MLTLEKRQSNRLSKSKEDETKVGEMKLEVYESECTQSSVLIDRAADAISKKNSSKSDSSVSACSNLSDYNQSNLNELHDFFS